MKLYYTNASKGDAEQKNPNLSLGGYVSSSPLPNGSINNLFGGISQYGKEKMVRQVRAVVLKNETGATQTPSIWYDNLSEEPITNYRFAFVALAQDECGWFMEKIDQGDATPNNAVFINPMTEINKVSLGPMANDGYMGIWIERTYNKNAVEEASKCANLIAKFEAENEYQISTITTVADVSDSLNGTYFNLDTKLGRYTIWYTTGTGVAPSITGRELIGVSIATNDTADQIASKTQAQIELLIGSRGEVSTEVAANVITITSKEYGSFPSPTAETSGFTMATPTAGTFNGLEQVEDMGIFIEY